MLETSKAVAIMLVFAVLVQFLVDRVNSLYFSHLQFSFTLKELSI